MVYMIKDSTSELDSLIDSFMAVGGFAHLFDVLSSAIDGHGFGFDFYNLFLSGDDWDTETDSFYFPIPIDSTHALIETDAYVDNPIEDSEIGYIPLEMLYKHFQQAVHQYSNELRHNPDGTKSDKDFISTLEEMLCTLKQKWNIY